jgi:hypothetical protein
MPRHSRTLRQSTMMWATSMTCVCLCSGCGRALLTADDAVVRADGNVSLRAYLQRKTGTLAQHSIENHVVRFIVEGGLVGEGKTDGEGLATFVYALRDQRASSFTAETEIDGQTLRDARPIFRFRPGCVGIIVDIDGTVSRTDVSDLMRKEGKKSQPIDWSQRVVQKLASTYNVAFLTARPRAWLEKTRQWVKENGYPDAPLYTAPGLRKAMQAGQFKREALAMAQQGFPDLLIGIGDMESDAYAYGANRMLTLIVGQEPDKDFGNHALLLQNWATLDRFFDANSELLHDAQRLRRTINEGGVVAVPLLPWREEPQD